MYKEAILNNNTRIYGFTNLGSLYLTSPYKYFKGIYHLSKVDF